MVSNAFVGDEANSLDSVSAIEYIYLLVTDWETAAREAETRNAAG
jgi:hypothetical protein